LGQAAPHSAADGDRGAGIASGSRICERQLGDHNGPVRSCGLQTHRATAMQRPFAHAQHPERACGGRGASIHAHTIVLDLQTHTAGALDQAQVHAACTCVPRHVCQGLLADVEDLIGDPGGSATDDCSTASLQARPVLRSNCRARWVSAAARPMWSRTVGRSSAASAWTALIACSTMPPRCGPAPGASWPERQAPTVRVQPNTDQISGP
jgi:hypothetical protein